MTILAGFISLHFDSIFSKCFGCLEISYSLTIFTCNFAETMLSFVCSDNQLVVSFDNFLIFISVCFDEITIMFRCMTLQENDGP